MSLFRNVVIVLGTVAFWLVTAFVMAMWPALNEGIVYLFETYLGDTDSVWRQYLYSAILHSVGALPVGFVVRATVSSRRPLAWVLAAAVLMSAILLSQTLDFWFLQLRGEYQFAEASIAVSPLLFCFLGATVAKWLLPLRRLEHAL